MPSERLIAFGPVVNYYHPSSWTPEVKALCRRVHGGDYAALAPLLAIDIKFIVDPEAIRALTILRTDPQYPPAKARRELRAIANVIQRRPARRRATMPHGDFLLAQLNGLATWIEANNLLTLKRDPAALATRIDQLLSEAVSGSATSMATLEVGWLADDGAFIPSPAAKHRQAILPARERAVLTKALLKGTKYGTGYVRTPRSWAREALAWIYARGKTKLIDKRIARDPIARAMKSAKPTRRRLKTSR